MGRHVMKSYSSIAIVMGERSSMDLFMGLVLFMLVVPSLQLGVVESYPV
jgi:hypothetical protein